MQGFYAGIMSPAADFRKEHQDKTLRQTADGDGQEFVQEWQTGGKIDDDLRQIIERWNTNRNGSAAVESLAEVVEAWSELPEHVRESILLLIRVTRSSKF